MKKTLIVLWASCTLLSCESMQEKSDYLYKDAMCISMITFGRHVSKPFVV